MIQIKFQKTKNVLTPLRASKGAAGFDFYIPSDMEWHSKVLYHGESVLIASGIKIELPEGYCLLAVNKSGLGSKGLSVGACLIDSDYRGEIHLNVFNNSNQEVIIKRGEKLVQFIVLSIPGAVFINEDVLSLTERGSNGFGSTGK